MKELEFKSELLREIIKMIQLRITEYKNYIQNKTVMGSFIWVALDENNATDSVIQDFIKILTASNLSKVLFIESCR